ncbi:Serine/threonine-protein kinase BLUS1 [Bienertia sinuspersici]
MGQEYPVDPKCYEIIGEIGSGVSAIVYKARCLRKGGTGTGTIVAIKSIDLDQSRADLDSIRLETKTMSLLCHPNILQAHCSFTVGRRLWVVMPFMSAGSLQSILSSNFSSGLPEPCIAVVLKETLKALSYLHDQGHVHRDVKAGNILVAYDGAVKLGDFGVSTPVFDANFDSRLKDIAGTPYWMAPEVIHSHNGYGFKADIWSFGITALELAHGRPPLSHLPPSKSLLFKITKRFRFSDYDTININNNKLGLLQGLGLISYIEVVVRPTADKLLRHAFFKNSKSCDFLVKNLLAGLPTVEERFKMSKCITSANTKMVSLGSASGATTNTNTNTATTTTNTASEDDATETGELMKKQRRVSGWNFNVEGVRFHGELVIPDKRVEYEAFSSSSASPGFSMGTTTPTPTEEVYPVDQVEEASLVALRGNLDEQRKNVKDLITFLGGDQGGGGETNKEEHLTDVVDRLRREMEQEKEKQRVANGVGIS